MCFLFDFDNMYGMGLQCRMCTQPYYLGACDQEDRALDLKSEGLGFDSTAGHV